MTNPSIHYWSKDRTQNGAIDENVYFAENQPPATLNNSNRGVMARHAEHLEDIGHAVLAVWVSAQVNHYGITIASSPAALLDNVMFSFTPHAGNTGPTQLSLNGFPPAPLYNKINTPTEQGDIIGGIPVFCKYVSSGNLGATENQFVIIGGIGEYVKQGVTSIGSGILLNNLTPAGTVQAWPAPISDTVLPPAGYLVCDGSEYSNQDYAELYAVIGDAYNTGGEQANHFRVPNYQGYFFRGAETNRTGASATVDPDVPGRTAAPGTWPGSVAAVQSDPGSTQTGGIQSHSHTIAATGAGTGTTSSDGNHDHAFEDGTQTWAWAGSVGGAFGGNFAVPVTPTNRSTTADAGSHSHTVTVDLAIDQTDTWTTVGAINETRPVNMYVHWIIFAKPADALAEQQALHNLAYRYGGEVSGPTNPSPGQFLFNNTGNNHYYFSRTGQQGQDYGSTLDNWDALGTATPQGILYAQKVGSPSSYAHLNATNITGDQGGYNTFETQPQSVGVDWLPNVGDQVGFDFTPIQAGTPGGGSGQINNSLDYRWTSAPVSSDPGSGRVSIDQWPAAIGEVRTLYINDADDHGTDIGSDPVNGVLGNWATSTNPNHKGYLRVFSILDGERDKMFEAKVTGAGTDFVNYWSFPIQIEAVGVGGEPTLSDPVAVDFSRTGDSQAGAITTGWHTLWVPASYMTAGVTSGPDHTYGEYGTNNILMQSLAYAPGVDEVAAFFLGMPNSWLPTAGLQFEPIWTSLAGTDATTVRWEFNGFSYVDGDNIDQAIAGAAAISDDPYNSAFKMQKGPITLLNLSGTPTKGDDTVYITVTRRGAVANDDFDGSAHLLGVNVYLNYDDPADL